MGDVSIHLPQDYKDQTILALGADDNVGNTHITEYVRAN